MRNEKIYAYFNKPSSTSVRHAHMAEELERELMTSIIALLRIGQASPWSSAEPARMLSRPPCSFVTCPSHRTPRPVRPRDEIRGLLETVAMQQAKSYASR
jgi:hypothetical protein